MPQTMSVADPVHQLPADPALAREAAELIDVLAACERRDEHSYEVVETRLESMGAFLHAHELPTEPSSLRSIRAWFHDATEPVLARGRLMSHARRWPRGYPGDFEMLEAVYANEPTGQGLARHLDRYFLSRTLAVAVRSRLRVLAGALAQRAREETGDAIWLNLACGPCRELVEIPPPTRTRAVHCIDLDSAALDCARAVVDGAPVGEVHFDRLDATQLVDSRAVVSRFGTPTTIYSAGLFDYIRTPVLVPMIAALYGSLSRGGVLIAPFKDASRYDTFDYHWVVRWHHFFQRREDELRSIFADAGIPRDAVSMRRDDTGVILLFTAKK